MNDQYRGQVCRWEIGDVVKYSNGVQGKRIGSFRVVDWFSDNMKGFGSRIVGKWLSWLVLLVLLAVRSPCECRVNRRSSTIWPIAPQESNSVAKHDAPSHRSQRIAIIGARTEEEKRRNSPLSICDVWRRDRCRLSSRARWRRSLCACSPLRGAAIWG